MGVHGPTLASAFEAQVRRTPDRVAVVDGDRRLDYADLNARANRVAHRLIRAGVGPDSLVCLTIPRSAELVVALLGVLKAGAGYLPVDPDYPADRVRFTVEDAAPASVLTREDVLDAAEGSGADTDPTDADRTRPSHPLDLAYVIYTLGRPVEPEV